MRRVANAPRPWMVDLRISNGRSERVVAFGTARSSDDGEDAAGTGAGTQEDSGSRRECGDARLRDLRAAGPPCCFATNTPSGAVARAFAVLHAVVRCPVVRRVRVVVRDAVAHSRGVAEPDPGERPVG